MRGIFIRCLKRYTLVSVKSCTTATLKNDTSVMWGVKLCAPFQPQISKDFSQKFCNCSKNSPVGHAYNIYSRGDVSSKRGSFTCARSQSEANCTPLFPVAANAFSLKTSSLKISFIWQNCYIRPMLRKTHL